MFRTSSCCSSSFMSIPAPRLSSSRTFDQSDLVSTGFKTSATSGVTGDGRRPRLEPPMQAAASARLDFMSTLRLSCCRTGRGLRHESACNNSSLIFGQPASLSPCLSSSSLSRQSITRYDVRRLPAWKLLPPVLFDLAELLDSFKSQGCRCFLTLLLCIANP